MGDEVKLPDRVELEGGAVGLNLVHPDLMPSRTPHGFGKKMRRTIVRVAKLVNLEATKELKELTIVQVPIEPGHNNHGSLNDHAAPLRHYLSKGVFEFPHEYDPEQFNFLYCAVSNCWSPAAWPITERCQDHEQAWQNGWIKYATKNPFAERGPGETTI
jgi:hypothetical protein